MQDFRSGPFNGYPCVPVLTDARAHIGVCWRRISGRVPGGPWVSRQVDLVILHSGGFRGGHLWPGGLLRSSTKPCQMRWAGRTQRRTCLTSMAHPPSPDTCSHDQKKKPGKRNFLSHFIGTLKRARRAPQIQDPRGGGGAPSVTLTK